MKTNFLTLMFMLLTLSLSAQLKMNSSGNVGIGGDPTSDKLQCNGTIGCYFINCSNRVTTQYLSRDDDYIPYHGYTYLGVGGEPTLKIQAGTESSYALNLIGDAYYNGTTFIWSDMNIKKDIQSIDNLSILEKISKIEGKQFKYKNHEELVALHESGSINFSADTISIKGITDKTDIDKVLNDTLGIMISAPHHSDKEHFGFIAQNVADIFPQCAIFDSATNIYSVDYIGFIPVLLEAVKVQQGKLDEMQSEIDELKIQVQQLLIAEETKKSASIESSDDFLSGETNSILYQNIPNPFTENTEIKYYLTENTGNAMINIYSMTGTQLKSIELHQTGNGSITINGGDFDAGMYMYALMTDGMLVDTKQMILTD